MKRQRLSLYSALLMTVAASLAPTQVRAQSAPSKVIDVFASEVQETVTVLDRHGKVAGETLTQDDFKVSENHELQAITQFGVDSLAVNTAVVLDCSMSMQGNEQTVVAAVRGFIDVNRDPRNRFAIVCAANTDQQFLLAPLTGDSRVLANGLSEYAVWGGTDIADALEKTARYLRTTRPEDFNQIVILTDGQDPRSHRKIRATLEHISNASNVAINAISVGATSSDAAQKYLLALAEGTGGFQFHVNTPAELGKAFDLFRQMTAKRYNIYYSPTQTGTGGMRTVSIELPRHPDLWPHYRMVYWANANGGVDSASSIASESEATASLPQLPPARSPAILNAPPADRAFCDAPYAPHEIGIRTQFTYRGKPRQLTPSGSPMAYLPQDDHAFFEIASPTLVGSCTVENHTTGMLSLNPGDHFWMNAIAKGEGAAGEELLVNVKGDAETFVIRLDRSTQGGDGPAAINALETQYGANEPTLAVRCQFSHRGVAAKMRLAEYLPLLSQAFDIDRSSAIGLSVDHCSGALGGGSFRSELETPALFPQQNSESSKGI